MSNDDKPIPPYVDLDNGQTVYAEAIRKIRITGDKLPFDEWELDSADEARQVARVLLAAADAFERDWAADHGG
jgi:hypothetical protein